MHSWTSAVDHVVVDHVGKRYRTTNKETVTALEDVSFSIRREEFVSIVGLSGCGKSTLLNMIAGLTPCSEGKIVVNGKTVDKPHNEVGIVFQDALLLEWRTALQNIMLQPEIRSLDHTTYEQRARELMRSVGLAGFENKHPYELSGGMRQRVSICRALIHDPTLLLMDEPFGALDALTRDDIAMELQSLWYDNKKTVLFVTHSIQEAVLLSDRVLVMSPRPGTIASIVDIDLPRLRPREIVNTAEFGRYAAEIRDKIDKTNRP